MRGRRKADIDWIKFVAVSLKRPQFGGGSVSLTLTFSVTIYENVVFLILRRPGDFLKGIVQRELQTAKP